MISPEPSTSRSTRAQAMAIVVMLAVATAGVAAGVVFDRTVLIKKTVPAQTRDTTMRSDRMGRYPNSDMRRRFSERFAKDLSLTPEQSAKIDVIMTRQFEEMRKASALVQPTIDSLSRAAQAAMDSLFTPEQRAKVKEMRQRGRERGGRGGDRGGPGHDSLSRSPNRQ